MIQTRKQQLRRLKPKKRSSYHARHDNDGHRVRLPEVRLSSRAKRIVLEQALAQRCTQSFLVEGMLKNYTIVPKMSDISYLPPPGRERIRVYVHPLYVSWMRQKAQQEGVSLSLYFSALIEHYYDAYAFELNIFRLWTPTNRF